MSDISDTVKAQIAALESLVIDLIRVTHRLDPDGLEDALDRKPQTPAGRSATPKVLATRAQTRRDQLIAAAALEEHHTEL